MCFASCLTFLEHRLFVRSDIIMKNTLFSTVIVLYSVVRLAMADTTRTIITEGEAGSHLSTAESTETSTSQKVRVLLEEESSEEKYHRMNHLTLLCAVCSSIPKIMCSMRPTKKKGLTLMSPTTNVKVKKATIGGTMKLIEGFNLPEDFNLPRSCQKNQKRGHFSRPNFDFGQADDCRKDNFRLAASASNASGSSICWLVRYERFLLSTTTTIN
jgi:hypothetical protein